MNNLNQKTINSEIYIKVATLTTKLEDKLWDDVFDCPPDSPYSYTSEQIWENIGGVMTSMVGVTNQIKDFVEESTDHGQIR